MKSFYLDQLIGDTNIDKLNNVEEITDKLELEQAIWIRLKTNRGEWCFDTEFGYPWFELFNDKATAEEFRLAMIETINQEERVSKILSAEVEELDRENRTLYMYFKAQTTEGLIESSQEVN